MGRGVIALDASALIALLKLEPGWEVVEQHLRASIISSVNLAETLSKYAEYGGDIDQAMSLFEEAAIEIVPASFEHAIDASRLRLPTKALAPARGDFSKPLSSNTPYTFTNAVCIEPERPKLRSVMVSPTRTRYKDSIGANSL